MANRIVKGVGLTTVSSVCRNIVSLLQLAILTRFLDKADFGIVAIASLFVSFTGMFLDMGISVGIIHKQTISKNEYSSLFWFNILLGIVLTLGLYLLAPLLTAGYHSEDLVSVVRLICLTIFLNSLGIQQKTYCQKKTYFGRLAIIEILGSVITMAVAVTSAYLGHGVYSLAYSTIAGALFMNVTHLIIGTIKDSRLSFHFSFNETIPFLKIGIYQIGAAVLDFFTRELDTIILSTTLGLEFLGVYNIAKRIPVAVYSFIQPIVVRVFTPLFAEKQSVVDVLRSAYMKLSKTLSWVSFPMYFLIAALSPTIITYVFGANYIDGVPVMMVFCLRYAFNGVNGVCGALQTATGRTDIGFKWTVFLIITTSLVYYITSSLGITVFLGGICGLTLVLVVMVWYIQFRPMVRVSFREYVAVFSRSFVICLCLAFIVFIINVQPSILYSVLASIFFIAVFAFLLLKSRDGKEVIEVMKMVNSPYKIVMAAEKIVSHESLDNK